MPRSAYLLPRMAVYPEFFDSIARLARSHSALKNIAASLRDTRVDLESWRLTLELEVKLLFAWALRRIVDLHSSETLPCALAPVVPTGVLALLPRYGFALHLLRRAVPFAALAIKTTVAFNANVADEAARMTEVVAHCFGLSGFLSAASLDPPVALSEAVKRGDLIQITGNEVTVRALRDANPSAHIFGATGRCCVVLGRSRDRVARVAVELMQRDLSVSCSNFGMAAQCESLRQEDRPALICRDGLQFDTLDQMVRAQHPSIILLAEEQDIGLPGLISGYRAVRCDDEAVPTDWRGFARDPLHGWPGDYLV